MGNEQFLVKVSLNRKASFINEVEEFDEEQQSELLVVKTVNLTKEEFDVFIDNILGNYDFIKDNEDYYKIPVQKEEHKKYDKALLIKTDYYNWGIVVDTQGYDYARYVARYELKTPAEYEFNKLGWNKIETEEDENAIIYMVEEHYGYDIFKTYLHLYPDPKAYFIESEVDNHIVSIELLRVILKALEEL